MWSWQGARVLITGVSGFIGSALSRRLLAEGAEIHGLSRGAPALSPGVRHHAADVASLADLQRVFAAVRPDLVYHLAGHVSGSRELDAVLPTLQGNLVGAVHVLVTAAEGGGCRTVLAGSLEEPDVDHPVPVSPYAASKSAATGYASMFAALYRLPVAVARIFMVYGPEQPSRRMLVPHTVFSLLRGESPQLSSGRRPIDWVFIDDVVEGLVRLGASDAFDGEPVDFGSGKLVTVRNLAERLAARIGGDARPLFGALPDRPDERVRRADVGATWARIAWRPQVSLDAGLERTIAWAREVLAAER